MLIFGGMNNHNYIGSSIFVINLDFHFTPEVIKEEERAMELQRISAREMGPEAVKKLEKIQRQRARRQLSMIAHVHLPPIK